MHDPITIEAGVEQALPFTLSEPVLRFLAAAMPGVALRHPDAARVRAIAADLVQGLYGGRLALAMLFGSQMTETAGVMSDCDLIVIFDGSAPNEKRQLVADGLAVELTAFRREDIGAFLRQSSRSGSFGLLHMVAHGHRLLGDAALHDALVEAARGYLAGQGPATPSQARSHMRARACSMLLKFMGTGGQVSAVLVAGRLVTLLAFLITRLEWGFSNDGMDFALRTLALHDPAAAVALEGAFADLLATGRRESLIHVAIEQIERLGGAVWDGVRVDIPPPLARHPGIPPTQNRKDLDHVS